MTSISATAAPGILPADQSNTGHACTSGTLLTVTVIGTFNTAVSLASTDPSASPVDSSVTAEEITADAGTGVICLTGVRTGPVAPAAGATVLQTG